ncbi:MAG: restriction endonuclease subunit S [bacterium]
MPFHDPLRTKAYLISGKSWVNNHAQVFQGILTSPRFLVHYLNVFDYAGRVVGATRAKLNQAQAVTIPVPLPPLAEQHRIVAKVDALMALCDRLEASLAATAATRRRLLDALLAEALAPVNARELEAAE